ncbi:MAG TPA: methyltransferase domain-containing protein [Gaiellaceae bacterium]
MSLGFRCPRCGGPLDPDAERVVCAGCGRVARESREQILDLLPAGGGAEQEHYDDWYDAERSGPPPPLRSLERHWRSRYYPMNEAVLERVGELAGRVVLLLGNGTSEKELSFLARGPAALVFSDLSPVAVQAARDRWAGELEGPVYWAAIDGTELPFADASVDLVYAYAMVHHVEDVRRLLAEAGRVLRPGGRAVFSDDAYSPLWQGAKLTVLKPLMRYFHRQEPPSPEDLRFTLHGGFRETELAALIRAAGCEPWFERSSFVHYLFTRASERLPPRRLFRFLAGRERLLSTLIALDRALGRLPGMRAHLIRLVWGMTKPAGGEERPGGAG